LEVLRSAPAELISRLEAAPKANTQVGDSFKVQRKLPGLIERLRGAAI
jgi:hypothetical protein